MARNPLQQYFEAGMQFQEITRDRAERIVRELVKVGEVRRATATAAVDELVERTRHNAQQLLDAVQTEVRNQLSVLESITKDAVDRLEGQVEALRQQLQDLFPGAAGAAGAARPARPPVAPPPTASAPAKKSPAKKSAAKRSAAKRTTKKKAATKKSAAKRTTAKKASAKRAAKKASG
jgi:polyhydroxyalkanoate synthesis regulator phasin